MVSVSGGRREGDHGECLGGEGDHNECLGREGDHDECLGGEEGS